MWGDGTSLHLYGSRAIGLALPHSDIDIAIMPPPGVSLDETASRAALGEVAAALEPQVTSLQRIFATAVPVVKAKVQLDRLGDRLEGAKPAVQATCRTLPRRSERHVLTSGVCVLQLDLTLVNFCRVGLQSVAMGLGLQASLPALKGVVLVLKQVGTRTRNPNPTPRPNQNPH